MEWRAVVGYEGLYEVSNEGHVKSLKRKGRLTDKLLRWRPAGKPPYAYANVALWKNGQRKDTRVHRIVATAFLPNPQSLPQVNHKDLDGLNNNTTNLEWITNAENKQHAINSWRKT